MHAYIQTIYITKKDAYTGTRVHLKTETDRETGKNRRRDRRITIDR